VVISVTRQNNNRAQATEVWERARFRSNCVTH
jgi:hypothetical protein